MGQLCVSVTNFFAPGVGDVPYRHVHSHPGARLDGGRVFGNESDFEYFPSGTRCHPLEEKFTALSAVTAAFIRGLRQNPLKNNVQLLVG